MSALASWLMLKPLPLLDGCTGCGQGFRPYSQGGGGGQDGRGWSCICAPTAAATQKQGTWQAPIFPGNWELARLPASGE